MSLNIKNERVHDLARQAARVTGKSLTGAIEEGLTLLLQRHGQDPAEALAEAKMDAVRAIAAEYRADAGRPRTVNHIEDLYDEQSGLPR